jgi:hypothetical protein
MALVSDLRSGVPRSSLKKGILSIVAKAVVMWESRRDFQGRWEEWKTCCWFSRLSTGRHFHRLLLQSVSRLNLLLLSWGDGMTCLA